MRVNDLGLEFNNFTITYLTQLFYLLLKQFRDESSLCYVFHLYR